MIKHKINLLLLTFMLLVAYQAGAQDKYWVFFKDKANLEFNPKSYFDEKAIVRREKQNIPFDESDKPVNTEYINKVSALADSMGYASRWLNAVAIYASPMHIEVIKKLAFVKEIEPMLYTAQIASVSKDSMATKEHTFLYYQKMRMEGDVFKKHNISGKGIRIAIMDVGYINVQNHEAFTHLFKNEQIIKTYDFISKKEDVYHGGTHGTMVLSCIAGKFMGQDMGFAPDAEFLLSRTERSVTEWKQEEDAWVAAAEWADKNGADIISTSLGYTNSRYFVHDMNGKVSTIARAANKAASKGILVIVAAGNDGDADWKYICTPADADSVLTVGGINPVTNIHIEYSSYGPTADGRLKPNVCAPSTDWVATKKGYHVEDGTSFATPLVAGFAACVLQAHPEYSAMQAFKAIEASAHLFPYYDYAHGYGVPKASYFFDEDVSLLPKKKLSVYLKDDDSIQIDIEDSPVLYLNENNSKNQNLRSFANFGVKDTSKLLYFHLADSTGFLTRYGVISVHSKHVLTINKNSIPRGGSLVLFYEGYIEEHSEPFKI